MVVPSARIAEPAVASFLALCSSQLAQATASFALVANKLVQLVTTSFSPSVVLVQLASWARPMPLFPASSSMPADDAQGCRRKLAEELAYLVAVRHRPTVDQAFDAALVRRQDHNHAGNQLVRNATYLKLK